MTQRSDMKHSEDQEPVSSVGAEAPLAEVERFAQELDAIAPLPEPPGAVPPAAVAPGRENGTGTAAQSPPLASPDLAELYIRQGEYVRGIAMYRQLLAQAPNDRELTERLKDAETLADLLILREPDEARPADRDARGDFAATMAGATTNSRDVKIARLTAWLDRIREQR